MVRLSTILIGLGVLIALVPIPLPIPGIGLIGGILLLLFGVALRLFGL
ncbi:transporter [Natranaeroarchaeum sulfidigenes]|nr:transporter [Natranaeroarchaeum sulfidigenes]